MLGFKCCSKLLWELNNLSGRETLSQNTPLFLPLNWSWMLHILDLDDHVRLWQWDIHSLSHLQFPGVGSVSQVVAVGHSGGAKLLKPLYLQHYAAKSGNGNTLNPQLMFTQTTVADCSKHLILSRIIAVTRCIKCSDNYQDVPFVTDYIETSSISLKGRFGPSVDDIRLAWRLLQLAISQGFFY